MPDVLRTARRYDLDALRREVDVARLALDFGEGTFGHSISLTAEDEIAAGYRDHRNNMPYADALSRCPALAAIFREFEAEKAAFRLLRREPGSAYSLHDDRDVPGDVVRMQLPIATNDASLLLVQRDGTALEPLARRVAAYGGDADTTFDYARAEEAFGAWFDFYHLEAGRFHAFDTRRVHTVINAGSAERVILCVDLLRNPWLDDWMAANLTEPVEALAPDRLPAGTWDWSALRHGLLSHPRVQLT